jgi:hypothetical protein
MRGGAERVLRLPKSIAGRTEAMSTTNNSNQSHEGWDKADLFFLADALKRGMSIEEVVRFLNRSQEEVRRRAALHERE